MLEVVEFDNSDSNGITDSDESKVLDDGDGVGAGMGWAPVASGANGGLLTGCNTAVGSM